MTKQFATIELKVNNHPGVMMHVVGLFARRAFNLEGIACLPTRDPRFSRIWLRVEAHERLYQLMQQLGKLVDVLEVSRHAAPHDAFVRLEEFFQS